MSDTFGKDISPVGYQERSAQTLARGSGASSGKLFVSLHNILCLTYSIIKYVGSMVYVFER